MTLLRSPTSARRPRPGPRPSRSRSTGVPVTVPRGTSVMRAAALAGVDIPKLCATDRLEPFGSCRLCLVEIDGRKGTPASCTTPVAPGMRVSHPDAAPGPSCGAASWSSTSPTTRSTA